jgi:hypothetical protein
MTYNLQDQWSEIKLKDYSKFYSHAKAYQNNIELIDKLIDQFIFHIFKIPKEDLYAMPLDSRNDIKTTADLLLNTMSTQKLVKKFEMFGVKYGFEPNLEEMPYGAYIDLIDACTNTWDNLALIAAILYRPIESESGELYTIKSYSGTKQSQIDMFHESLNMDIVLGCIAFFLSLQTSLTLNSLAYSTKQIMNQVSTSIH